MRDRALNCELTKCPTFPRRLPLDMRLFRLLREAEIRTRMLRPGDLCVADCTAYQRRAPSRAAPSRATGEANATTRGHDLSRIYRRSGTYNNLLKKDPACGPVRTFHSLHFYLVINRMTAFFARQLPFSRATGHLRSVDSIRTTEHSGYPEGSVRCPALRNA